MAADPGAAVVAADAEEGYEDDDFDVDDAALDL